MFKIAAQLLSLGFDCNADRRLDGKACCAVFDAARQVLNDAGFDGDGIVEVAIWNGEYEEQDLMDYAGVELSTQGMIPCVIDKETKRFRAFLQEGHG